MCAKTNRNGKTCSLRVSLMSFESPLHGKACALSTDACAIECEKRAAHHDHCRICAEACRKCKASCHAMSQMSN